MAYPADFSVKEKCLGNLIFDLKECSRVNTIFNYGGDLKSGWNSYIDGCVTGCTGWIASFEQEAQNRYNYVLDRFIDTDAHLRLVNYNDFSNSGSVRWDDWDSLAKFRTIDFIDADRDGSIDEVLISSNNFIKEVGSEIGADIPTNLAGVAVLTKKDVGKWAWEMLQDMYNFYLNKILK